MADTLRKINCPACGKEMEKVFIPSEGINVDICTDGCGGIYFDNRELDAFDEANEDVSVILEKLENKKFIPVNTSEERRCPVCESKMVKNYSSIHKNVEVDECYTCGGKFLDNNELLKIRAEYSTEAERSADVIEEVYKTIGDEMAELTKKYVKARQNKNSKVVKVFMKLLGL